MASPAPFTATESFGVRGWLEERDNEDHTKLSCRVEIFPDVFQEQDRPIEIGEMAAAGKALADAYPEALRVFDEVDAALGESLSKLIFEGPEERLTLRDDLDRAVRRYAGPPDLPGRG